MPVRRMTQQEVREWLGSGIVLSGFKPPKRLPLPSEDEQKSTEAAQGDLDQPFRGAKSDC